jgi:N-acetylneuraminic acid mutarotase
LGLDSVSHLGFLNDLWEFSRATNEWAWMGGSSTNSGNCVGGGWCGQPGVYGNLGTPASGNIPGGRQTAASWTDGSGNFWLFGGSGFDSAGTQGYLNDLWMFNPSTRVWTWIGGSNTVPEYSCNQGMYGTLGTPAAGSIPGGRINATSWTDKSGNLWLFGGSGCAGETSEGSLNDLWEFNPSTSLWVWKSGNSVIDPSPAYNHGQSGTYGALQTPSPTNIPGGREGAVGWIDSSGSLWLLGGYGYDAAGTLGYMNDLWEFNPSINEWDWMSGSSTGPTDCPYDDNNGLNGYCGPPGVYGTIQTPVFGNTPGGRENAAAWTDSKGNFWLMGGIGYDSGNVWGYLNDLWEFPMNAAGLPVAATPVFSPGPGTYTSWETVNISSATPNATIYYMIDGITPATVYTGPITVSSSQTIEAIAWASGYASSAVATANYVANLPTAAAPTLSLAPGTYGSAQTLTISDTTPGATIYYAVGQAPSTSSSLYSGLINVSTSEIIEAIAVANGYLNSAVVSAAYTIWPNPALGEWAWISGSSTTPTSCTQGICAQIGVYGTLGTPAVGNVPGGRDGANGWVDKNGHFWIFGGNERDANNVLSSMNDLWEFDPSNNEWAWMGGSSTAITYPGGFLGKAGVYGTKGTPAAENVPGGRQYASSWTDQNGHFWLFGGSGFDSNGSVGFLNDLWEFDPSTKEWTWVSGSSSIPCYDASAAQCWGQPGVYGILKTPSAGNTPGGRAYSQNWTDSNGHLWLYGGYGWSSKNQCVLNDLWEFNPTTKEWTWNSGYDYCAPGGGDWDPIYGTPGVPATGNTPWGVQSAISWTDNHGNFWLFGGNLNPPIGICLCGPAPNNELWKYSPSLGQWAFMGGGGTAAVFGTMGQWDPSSIPGATYYGSGWTDSSGDLWLFGGFSMTAANNPAETYPNMFSGGLTSNIWKFGPATNDWVMMNGSAAPEPYGPPLDAPVFGGAAQEGVYGTLGSPAFGNAPGGRQGAVTWTDSKGNLWLFGGWGAASESTYGLLNDLWEFQPSLGPSPDSLPQAATPVFSVTSGTYGSAQTVAISDSTPGTAIYVTRDGSTPSQASQTYWGPITVAATDTIQAVAMAFGYKPSSVASATYIIQPVATPTFSVPAGTYTSTQTVAISDTTAGAVIYYTTDGSIPTKSSTVYGGPITVSSTEQIQAFAAANGIISNLASAWYTVNLPPDFSIAATPAAMTVIAGDRGTTTVAVVPANGFNAAVSFACSGLPSGASCSFSPATVTPYVVAAPTTLTVATSATKAALRRPSNLWLPGTALAAIVCCFGRKRRRGCQFILLLAAAFAGLGLVSSCGAGGASGGGNGGGSGGNGGGGGSKSVTSTVTVTATSGTLSHSTTFSLTME